MTGAQPARCHQPPTAVRIDLEHGDVSAIEVIEDGDRVRLAIYDNPRSAIPLISGTVSRSKRHKLISALASVDIARRRRA